MFRTLAYLKNETEKQRGNPFDACMDYYNDYKKDYFCVQLCLWMCVCVSVYCMLT